MFIKLCKKRGQNTAEYAILIGVIVAAAIAMQVYVRRGMQARVKSATDYTMQSQSQAEGETGYLDEAALFQDKNVFKTSQYEPYYANSSFERYQNSLAEDRLLEGGNVSRTGNTYSNQTGYQQYDTWENAGT